MHRESLLEMRLKYMWKKTCELEFTWLFLFVKQSLAVHKIHIQLSSVKQKGVAMDEVWRWLTCRKLAWILPVEVDPPIGEHPPQSRQYASIVLIVSKSQSNLNWFSNFYASTTNWTSIESQSLSSRWRTPPGFGEGWSHGNHRQGISAQRGEIDYLNFTMNLMSRCGPLGHKYVQPTWETTYSKTFRKPTTASTTQYFTKSVR